MKPVKEKHVVTNFWPKILLVVILASRNMAKMREIYTEIDQGRNSLCSFMVSRQMQCLTCSCLYFVKPCHKINLEEVYRSRQVIGWSVSKSLWSKLLPSF